MIESTGSRDAIQKQLPAWELTYNGSPGASFRGGVATAAGSTATLKMDDVIAIRANCRQ